MDVILSHVNADFDSLGSMVGAGRLYSGAALVLPGGESAGVREFLALHQEALGIRAPADVDPDSITRVVVVDTRSRKRLGKLAAWLDLPEVEVHVFDHHLDVPSDLTAAYERLERWGAAASILAHELRAHEVQLTPIEATAMLLGIYADTGHLTYGGTRPEDLEAAAWLMRSGADLQVVEHFTRRTLTPEQRSILHHILDTMDIRDVGGATVVIGVAPPGPFVEDCAVLASLLTETDEADAAFLLAEMEGTLYVIGRSRTDSVDVGGTIRDLGGGGHRRAASARLKGESAPAVLERLMPVLERHVARERTAREIMSYPVRTVPPDMPVAEVRRRMVRYGHSGLLVMEEGKIAGIATRRDVDKARHHRLDHAPIRGFMTRDVRTVAPQARLSDLEDVMTEHGIGRLPVLNAGQVVGMVTRTDVLRALHGARYVRGIPKPEEETVGQRMREGLPARVQRVLEDVGALAEREGARAYVVGGFVRDLLLEVRNLDLDVLVEPDGVALARLFAQEHGGEFKDKRFGTAQVRLEDGTVVDFATARTESYAQPGALPEVEPSSIVDDLRRRDFTINAMAADLAPERFGDLLDPFGGRADLDRRRIRVLHNLSFVEDPTRIFRAVRFENRFHFQADAHTEALAREAIRSDALARITPERLRKELFLTFREERSLGALLRLQELGFLEWLAPELKVPEELLQSVPGALEWGQKRLGAVESSVVLLAALLSPLPVGEAVQTAERRLRVPPPLLRRITEGLEALERPEAVLPEGAPPAELTRSLKPLAAETLVLLRAGAGERVGEALERFATRWRDTKLEITGETLKGLGYRADAALGEALRRTLDARLNGEVEGAEAELAYARAILDGAAKDEQS